MIPLFDWIPAFAGMTKWLKLALMPLLGGVQGEGEAKGKGFKLSTITIKE